MINYVIWYEHNSLDRWYFWSVRRLQNVSAFDLFQSMERTKVNVNFVSVARNSRNLISLELSPVAHMFHMTIIFVSVARNSRDLCSLELSPVPHMKARISCNGHKIDVNFRKLYWNTINNWYITRVNHEE